MVLNTELYSVHFTFVNILCYDCFLCLFVWECHGIPGFYDSYLNIFKLLSWPSTNGCVHWNFSLCLELCIYSHMNNIVNNHGSFGLTVDTLGWNLQCPYTSSLGEDLIYLIKLDMCAWNFLLPSLIDYSVTLLLKEDEEIIGPTNKHMTGYDPIPTSVLLFPAWGLTFILRSSRRV